MTTDPLAAAALLGTSRMTAMPPPPDPSLENVWSSIDTENPATAVLHGLALVRPLRRAGAKTRAVSDDSPACPPETREPLPAAAVDLALRLLSGEYPEVLPEWLRLATASGRLLPARVLPDLLAAATKHHSLRAAVPALAGERGPWLARRHPQFSWLLENAAVDETAWETGQPAERIAWLRQTRNADPAAAADAIAGSWSGEDAAMREAMLRLVSENPQPCDEAWLESLALKDRRQEIRELAAVSLSGIPASAFRARAIARVRRLVKVERRLLKRVIAVEPPAAFDPAWAVDGIKEKPPQGTGERAWWLRQIVSLIPLDEWPALLGIAEHELFSLAREKDWQDALVAGWIDAARRMPGRTLATHSVPFIAALEAWPAGAVSKTQVIESQLAAMPVADRFAVLDLLAKNASQPLVLDLLARCGEAPPPGVGRATLSVLDQALAATPTPFIRPQARALAICIPPAEIQRRLETLARLPELSSAAEEFATTLEFRRSMISQFQIP